MKRLTLQWSKLKHVTSLSTLRPTATRFRKFTKNETRKAYNLIIGPPLFVDQSHRVLTAAVPFSSFTTGNSCNVCHMCGRHQQSRKLLRKVPHLPQDNVYSLRKRGKRSGHFSALRPQIKGKKQRWDDSLSRPPRVWRSTLGSEPLPVSNSRRSEVLWNLIRPVSDEQALNRKDSPLLFIAVWQMGQREQQKLEKCQKSANSSRDTS